MSRHKITVLRTGFTNGMDWEAEYEITFEFRKGAPAQAPSYSHGGLPADPDEIEFVSIKPDAGDHGAFSDLAQQGLEDWASDWLQGDGYDAALEMVAADHEAGLEFAAELRSDR